MPSKTALSLAFALGAALLFFGCGGDSSRPQFKGTVKELTGSGRQFIAEKQAWSDLRPNASVQAGDSISTQEESKASIVFGNGSVITVDEGTTIGIEELINQDMRHTVRIHNVGGTVLSDIKKLAASNSYEVVTPTATAAIRGTFFAVSFFPISHRSRVHVWDGIVMVHNPALTLAPLAVGAGFFTMIALGAVPIVPVHIEYREFAHFEHVMPPGQYKKMMRHYHYIPMPSPFDPFDDFQMEKKHRMMHARGPGMDLKIKDFPGAGFDVKVKEHGRHEEFRSDGNGREQQAGEKGKKGKGKKK